VELSQGWKIISASAGGHFRFGVGPLKKTVKEGLPDRGNERKVQVE
jgi:hypothetical protein